MSDTPPRPPSEQHLALRLALDQANPDPSTILQICRSLNHIPDAYRADIYRLLLDAGNVNINDKDDEDEFFIPEVRDQFSTSQIEEKEAYEAAYAASRAAALAAAASFSDTSSNNPTPHPSSPPPPTRTRLQPAIHQSPLRNQRVIKADSLRSRGDSIIIEKILTHYCKKKNISYKQGINEVLTPFLYLFTDKSTNVVNEKQAYKCFVSFLNTYLPTHVYSDDDSTALQCCFSTFRLLILYHEPKLCKLLDGHRLQPELFASGWFLTLFAQRLEITDNSKTGGIFSFWDLYLLHDDPYLHHFICLALLLRSIDKLTASSSSDLIMILQAVSLEITEIDPSVLFAEAKLLADNTPKSYVALLKRTCWGNLNKRGDVVQEGLNEKGLKLEKQSLMMVLKCLGTWSCLPISSDEAIGFALKDWGVIERVAGVGNSGGKKKAHIVNELTADALKNADADKNDNNPPTILLRTTSINSCESISEYNSEFDDTESDVDGFSDDEDSGGEENDNDDSITTSSPFPSPSPFTSSSPPPLPSPHFNSPTKHRKYITLDVRSKAEFDECHVYGSIWLDSGSFNTGEVTSVIESFEDMPDCHFTFIGNGSQRNSNTIHSPSYIDSSLDSNLQMSVNPHLCGPNKTWIRKRRLKNQAETAVSSSTNFLKNIIHVSKTGGGYDRRIERDELEELEMNDLQVGTSEDSSVSAWVLMFLQHDFKNISFVKGGIQEIIVTLRKAGSRSGVGLAEGGDCLLEGLAIDRMSEQGKSLRRIKDAFTFSGVSGSRSRSGSASLVASPILKGVSPSNFYKTESEASTGNEKSKLPLTSSSSLSSSTSSWGASFMNNMKSTSSKFTTTPSQDPIESPGNSNIITNNLMSSWKNLTSTTTTKREGDVKSRDSELQHITNMNASEFDLESPATLTSSTSLTSLSTSMATSTTWLKTLTKKATNMTYTLNNNVNVNSVSGSRVSSVNRTGSADGGKDVIDDSRDEEIDFGDNGGEGKGKGSDVLTDDTKL